MRTVLVLALVAALVSPAHSLAANGGCATQWVEAYDVSLETDKKVYRLGQIARVEVVVTEPTTGAPVSEATVTAGVLIDDLYYLNGRARTNAQGVAIVKLPLRRGVLRAGWAELRGIAQTYHDEAEAVCGGVGFYGYQSVDKAFRVTR